MMDEYLSCGDTVTLEHGEGFLTVDICGRICWETRLPGHIVPPNYDRCLWKVSTKLIYQNPKDEKERDRNQQMLDNPGDKPVVYGSVIQLWHVATGKFLASKNIAAKQAPDCLVLRLRAGSAAAYFEMLPKYKVRSEGSPVLAKDVILLSSVACPGYFAHDSPYHRGTMLEHEANLSKSVNECGISINLYKQMDPSGAPASLQIHQCMRLFDKETNGFVSASCSVPQPTETDSLELAKHEAPFVVPLTSQEVGHMHQSEFRSGQVWVIEHAPEALRRVGGAVEWDIPQYRIKNSATNRYITVGVDVGITTVSAKSGIVYQPVSLELHSRDILHRQVFQFCPVDEPGDYISPDNSSVSICHIADSGHVWYMHVSGHENIDNGVLIDEPVLVVASDKKMYDALLVVNVDHDQGGMVREVRNFAPALDNYLHHLNTSYDPALKVLNIDRVEIDIANDVLLQILCNSNLDTVGVLDRSIVTQDGEIREGTVPYKLFQHCARDQNLLTILCQIVAAPVNNEIVSAPSFFAKSEIAQDGRAEWTCKQFKKIAFVHRLVWSALSQLVMGNHRSMMKIASVKIPYRSMLVKNDLSADADAGDSAGDSLLRLEDVNGMKIAIEQVAYPVGAAKLLNTLIDDNVVLLNDRNIVNKKTIDNFVALIEKFGPQAHFLEFFNTISSCTTHPLPKNQLMLLRKLVTRENGTVESGSVLMHESSSSILLELYTLPPLAPTKEGAGLVPDDPNRNQNPAEPVAAAVESSKCTDAAVAAAALESTDSEPNLSYLGADVVENQLTKDGKITWPVVYVKWVSDSNWSPSSHAALYVTPAQIGMKPDVTCDADGEHFRLEELCRVLNEIEHPKAVTRSLDRDASLPATITNSPGTKLVSEKHVMMARYFHAQIDLMAELLLGRNAEAISSLEELYPYLMLVSILNTDGLPNSIRSSFIKLTKRLWVERAPCEANCGRLSLPDHVWYLDELQKIPSCAHDSETLPRFQIHDESPLRHHGDSFYRITSPDKYKLLTDVIHKFLGRGYLIIDDVENSRCIREMVSLVAALTSFGFYSGTTEHASDLAKQLVPILDGRTDMMTKSDKESSVDRYVGGADRTVVMEAKGEILRALVSIIDLRQQFRLAQLLKLFQTAHESNKLCYDAVLEGIPTIYSDTNSDTNCLNMTKISSEVQIEYEGQVLSGDFYAMLIDLLMYDHDELFETVLNMLVFEASPMKALVESSARVLMLPHKKLPVFKHVDTLQCYVSQLRREFEHYDLWDKRKTSKVTKYSDLNTGCSFENVWNILDKIKVFLSGAKVVDSFEDGESVGHVALETKQMLLYHLDVPNILMQVLGWHVLIPPNVSEPQDLFASRYKALYRVVQASLEVMHDIIAGNKQLRVFFRKFTSKLAEKRQLFPLQVFALLSATYCGSVVQVQSTPAELFLLFGDLLSNDCISDNMVALNFFLQQLIPDSAAGDVIVRNQKLVGKGLETTLSSPYSLFLFDIISGDVLFEHHVTGMNVLAHACHRNIEVTSSVGNKIVKWRSAISKLTQIMENLIYIICQQYDVVASGLGVGLESVTGTPSQYMDFVVSYLRYCDWMYMDPACVNINVVADHGMWACVDTVSRFVKAVCDARQEAAASADEASVPVASLACPSSGMMLKAVVSYNILDIMLDFLNSFVVAVTKCHVRIQSQVGHAVRNACATFIDYSVPVNMGTVSNMCNLMGFSDLEQTIGAPAHGSDATPIAVNLTAVTAVAKLTPVRSDPYGRFSSAMIESEFVKDQMTADKCKLLRIFLDARKLTDPMYFTHLSKEERVKIRHGLSNGNSNGTSSKVSPEFKASEKQIKDEISSMTGKLRTNPVHFDDLVARMVRYVDNQITCRGNHMVTSSILDILRSYIENDDGESAIYEDANEDGHQDKAFRQDRLVRMNVAELCFRAMVTYDSGEVFDAAIELGTLLLQDGNRNSQKKFIELAKTTDSDGYFFTNLDNILNKTGRWVVETQAYVHDPVAKRPQLCDIRSCLFVIEFMQQLCEGHNLESQNLLRDQSEVKRFTHSLIAGAVNLLCLLAPSADVFKKLDEVHSLLLVNVMDFLVDAVQGPCEGNQRAIASYDALAACTIILSSTIEKKAERGNNHGHSHGHANKSVKIEAMYYLKCTVINLLAAVLENSRGNDALSSLMSEKVHKSVLDGAYLELHERLYEVKQGHNFLGVGVTHAVALLKGKKESSGNVQGSVLDDALEKYRANPSQLITTCLCHLLAVYDKTIPGGVPLGDNGDVVEMPKSHKVFAKGMGQVEIFRNEISERIFFPIPDEVSHLSQKTKFDFIDNCDLSSCDTRVESLMDCRNDFIDEISVLEALPWYFQIISKNYKSIKMAFFAVILLINFNLILILKRGHLTFWVYYDGSASTSLMGILGVIALVGYFSYACYWTLRVSAFNKLKYERAESDMPPAPKFTAALKGLWANVQDKASDITGSEHRSAYDNFLDAMALGDSLTALDPTQFAPFVLASSLYLAACFIHYSFIETKLDGWSYGKLIFQYVLFGVIIGTPILIYCLRSVIVTPQNTRQLLVVLFVDTITNSNLVLHWVMVLIIASAVYGYVFLYCMILLDFITMSVHAQNTVRSVAIPFQPLLNVAMMFIITIFIFGIFALVRIGHTHPLLDGRPSVNDDDSVIACNSAWTCLGVVFYGGLISTDISSVLSGVEPGVNPPGAPSFTSRFFYDLFFFIVVGCLLFNMVTGIIVDTFSALREEADEIERLKTEETFISGITSDHLEGTDIDIMDVQNEQQELWNYMHYTVYLLNPKHKDPLEYDGMEMYVADCIQNQDNSWFPHKTCRLLEQESFKKRQKETEAGKNAAKLDKLEREMHNLLTEMNKISLALDRVSSTLPFNGGNDGGDDTGLNGNALARASSSSSSGSTNRVRSARGGRPPSTKLTLSPISAARQIIGSASAPKEL